MTITICTVITIAALVLACGQSSYASFTLKDEKELGKQFGFEYAEAFHYIGPRDKLKSYTPNMTDYIEKNAVPN